MTKKILMIAGPNGAGKTTIEIARGMAPLNPEKVALAASKLMVSRLKELLDQHKNIAFETTAAGRNYVKHLTHAKNQGYELYLIFLWLASAQQAIDRVSRRVAQGGHAIPHDVIKKRYKLGLENLVNDYLPLANRALILDNTTTENRVIARKPTNGALKILDVKIWEKIGT
jgi:predicted ABC-type ATPase